MATKTYLKQKESCKMLPNNKKRQARWLVMLIMIMIVSMLSACGKSKGGAEASASPANETRTDAEALKLAKEVKVKLDKGGDFAALAKQYSDDGGSKDNGGRYADAKISQWVTEFKEAAATLPINKISDPVKTSYGYHVMKVINRKVNTLADEKETLRSQLGYGLLSDFMTKEFPTLEYKSNIPTPTPVPSATPDPSATPEAPTATPAHKDSDVAAVYKGGQVTFGELNKYIDTTDFLNPQQAGSKGTPGYDEGMLKQLVLLKVVGELSSEENKKDSDVKTKQQSDAFKKYYDTNKAAMDPQLKASNIEIKDIEAYFHTLVYALNDMSKKVTDKQIQDDFDAKIKADKYAFTTATVDHILIAIKAPAPSTEASPTATPVK
jgi:hypothetical protein